jgi:hypothetical protein
MKSWKTTIFGLLAAIGGGIVAAHNLKPDLLAELPKCVPGLGYILSFVATAGIGLAARDNDKTSEDVGANKPAPGQLGSGAASLFLIAGLAGLMIGCQATPARIAYTGVAGPAITVDTAMTAWGGYVAQFHPAPEVEQKVKAAFERYQAAELLAIDAAQMYAEMASSSATNSAGSRVRAELASQTAANALADLVGLLRNLGVKL